jgi:hypothetical protein
MLLGSLLRRLGSGGCGGLALTGLADFVIIIFDDELWGGILQSLCLIHIHILDLLFSPQQLLLERTRLAFDFEDGGEDALKNA